MKQHDCRREMQRMQSWITIKSKSNEISLFSQLVLIATYFQSITDYRNPLQYAIWRHPIRELYFWCMRFEVRGASQQWYWKSSTGAALNCSILYQLSRKDLLPSVFALPGPLIFRKTTCPANQHCTSVKVWTGRELGSYISSEDQKKMKFKAAA